MAYNSFLEYLRDAGFAVDAPKEEMPKKKPVTKKSSPADGVSGETKPETDTEPDIETVNENGGEQDDSEQE